MNPRSFFSELKRRNVYKVAVAYAVVDWLLVQVATHVFRRLLSVPAGQNVSIARLKIDPVWDPIRNDPGFQQFLTTKENIGL